jgi:hypothetical protein
MNKSIFHPTFRFDRSKTETEEAEENEKQESASSVRSLAGDIVSEAQHFWR